MNYLLVCRLVADRQLPVQDLHESGHRCPVSAGISDRGKGQDNHR